METVNQTNYQSPYRAPIACGFSRASVEEFASTLAVDLGLDSGKKLETAVHDLGGTIHYVDSLEAFEETTDGSIVVNGIGDFQIFLANDVGYARTRFTLAHELGHYALHFVNGAQQPIKAQRYGSGETETEANWFAAALLMPTEQFKQAHDELNGSHSALAEKFGVSRPAVEIRSNYLGLA